MHEVDRQTRSRAPRPTAARLSRGIAQAMRQPEMINGLRADGSAAIASSPGEFRALIVSDREKWRRVIRDACRRPE